MTVCGLGPQVFLNCAGFIKIDTAAISDTTTNYIEVLDGSRVHPETYEWAKKMAVDALEYDEVTKLACVEVAWQLLGILCASKEEGEVLFAEDAVLCGVFKDCNDAESLQQDLNTLVHWVDTWQMSFNAKKCTILRVSCLKFLVE